MSFAPRFLKIIPILPHMLYLKKN